MKDIFIGMNLMWLLEVGVFFAYIAVRDIRRERKRRREVLRVMDSLDTHRKRLERW